MFIIIIINYFSMLVRSSFKILFATIFHVILNIYKSHLFILACFIFAS